VNSNGQIPLERPDRTLSETRVYDPVSDKVHSGSLEPDPTLKSGRVALVEFDHKLTSNCN